MDPAVDVTDPPADQGEQAPDPGGTGKRRRGRPREADRTPAILDAVLHLLHDGGYDRLRVQDVAERAGVGLGTIYRRWPTKQALVIEALQCDRALDEKFADTGNPRADLETTFRNIASAMAEHGDVVGFVASIRSEPEVAEIFRSTSLAAMRGRVRTLLAAARGTDVDDPALDLLTDLGPAVILFRVALACDTGDVDQLARDVTELLVTYRAG
jgi:AcrR family transcriptional regulator